MNDQRQFDIIDWISVISFIVGLVNLRENEEQSAHNDVQKANEQQEKHILDELGKRLDRQDAMLNKILEVITNGDK